MLIQAIMTLFRDGQCEPLKQWPEWAQTAGFAVCMLFINLAIGLAIAPLGFHGASPTKERMIDQRGILFAFLFIVIAGPFLETIIGQWLPLFVGRLAKRSPSVRILWAACWFSILHITEGFVTMLQTFGVGWILASCFVFNRDEGWMKAYRVTSIAHALHNLVLFIIY